MPRLGPRLRTALAVAVLGLASLAAAGVLQASSPPDPHALLVSPAAGTERQTLDGAVLGGRVDIEAATSGAIADVRFFVDDRTRAGEPRLVDDSAPFVLEDLDTGALTDGPHVVTAEIRVEDGTTAVVESSFVARSATTGSADGAIRINAGGSTSVLGSATWNGCKSLTTCGGILTGGFQYWKSGPIAGEQAPATETLYVSEWTGGATGPNPVAVGRPAFSFRFPVRNGQYFVRLHFAELVHTAAGKRVFDVAAEGRTVIDDLDIFKASGGLRRALKREVSVPVADGILDLDFIRQVENAKVSAIEIVPDARGSWATRAASPQTRFEANGAAAGGRLWVFGGFTGGYVGGTIASTARSDVYDPAANAWRRIADMPAKVTHAPVVAVGTELWVLGGFAGDFPGPSVRDVWIYDTVAGTWRPGPPLPGPRGAHAAALTDGELHVFGGVERTTATNTYDDRTEHWVLDATLPDAVWEERAPLPVARNHLGGIGVGGKAYAIGGQVGGDEAQGNRTDVHRYDPRSDRWTRVAGLPVARGHITAGVIEHEGRILVLGGTRNGNVPAGDVAGYDPALDRWRSLPSLPAGRKAPVAGRFGNRIVSTTGGLPGPSTSTWAMTLPSGW